jgi:hypothetical protein
MLDGAVGAIFGRRKIGWSEMVGGLQIRTDWLNSRNVRPLFLPQRVAFGK